MGAFLDRARENFRHSGLDQDAALSVHDSTRPFPDDVHVASVDIVVCNAPWGWRLKNSGPAVHMQDGQEEQEKEVCAPGFDAGADVSSRIVMNLLTEFPSAVFAFVCPVIPSASALASKGFSVRLSCALGQSAVWILT